MSLIVAREVRKSYATEAVHAWDQQSPCANVPRMIDVMIFFIRLRLIAIVLISILNVMLMAVYERVREIGTIAAIGTLPARSWRCSWSKALHDAFVHAAAMGHVVMTVTLSNACPVEG